MALYSGSTIDSYERSKRTANTIPLDCDDSEYDYDSEEDDFYDNYEPYEEDFDNGEYQPFLPEEEEKEHQAYVSARSIKIIKPFNWMNSPTKSGEQSPTKPVEWWDKNTTVSETERVINGVLNYAALLPPPTPKPKQAVKQPKPKNSKRKSKQPLKQQAPKEVENNVQMEPQVYKSTRLCLSVIKKTKCFHGKKCRYAHDYSDLKECNFGERCKKIYLVKTNPDGSLELANKNGATCNFKHSKESQASYLKRVPQQNTSPKN